MITQKYEENLSLAPNDAVSNSNHTRGGHRILQDNPLVWIDADNKDYRNTLEQLKSSINQIDVFSNPDDAVDFITDFDDIKVLLVVENTLGQHMIPDIHDIPQINAIYSVCHNTSQDQQWTKQWNKMKSAPSNINELCQAVQLSVRECSQNSIALSFIPVQPENSRQNLNQLDPKFMYTQIFKEILLGIQYNEQAIRDFTEFCRAHDYAVLDILNRFEKEYRSELAVFWYTSQPFLYSLLNRALRTMEGDIIIKMGFFIRDLHQQLKYLHQQQLDTYEKECFTVYRGQGLSHEDFQNLLKTKGGLLSFNNFLSTSKNEVVALIFATSVSQNPNQVGILFRISIDPLTSQTAYAYIEEISQHEDEQEILFSMHSVFRVSECKSIDNNNGRLYQVELKLTADDDAQLNVLTSWIKEEVATGTGWQRLGHLLLIIGQFDKAEELYMTLLKQTSNDSDEALYYHQLGSVKLEQGNHPMAAVYYAKSLKINEKLLPANHPHLATSYNNLAVVHKSMRDYTRALEFAEKALELWKKIVPPNHPVLATSYNAIGAIYESLEKHSKALEFFNKALETWPKTRLPSHHALGTFYSNMADVYRNMGEHSNAFLFYDKALEMWQKTLPSDHSSFADFYINTAAAYKSMGNNSKALSLYENAIVFREKTFSADHPDMAECYNNIGLLHNSSGEYSKALPFFEKALHIRKKCLPKYHPDLAQSRNNIGLMYYNTKEYSKALKFFEKAAETWEKTIPPDYSSLAAVYNNIGTMCVHIRDYTKALPFLEKTIEIFEKTLPQNHLTLAAAYNNIGLMYYNTGDYSKSLFFYEKALELKKQKLRTNHPDLAISYNKIADIHYNRKEFSEALPYYERALHIFRPLLPASHHDLENIKQAMETAKKNLEAKFDQ